MQFQQLQTIQISLILGGRPRAQSYWNRLYCHNKIKLQVACLPITLKNVVRLLTGHPYTKCVPKMWYGARAHASKNQRNWHVQRASPIFRNKKKCLQYRVHAAFIVFFLFFFNFRCYRIFQYLIKFVWYIFQSQFTDFSEV